jgi:uncharacterized protein
VTNSALYIGNVYHARVQPFRHAFKYRVFSLLLDLDELDSLSAKLKLFARNRFGLLSFHDKDHGAGDGDAKAWAARAMQDGLGFSPARVKLLCFPRLWGFVFNPLAIYYGYDADGRLRAILHQVSNTFGERHSLLMPVTQAGSNHAATLRHASAKLFHVSPFFPVSGGYAFRMNDPAEDLSVVIRYHSDAEQPLMVARHTAHRAALTDAGILKAVLGHPLMTLKVWLGIHWEALKLVLKGATYHKKPSPPAAAVTVVAAGQSSKAA